LKTLKYRIIQVPLWIIFYLGIMDVGANIVFRLPADPENTPPSFLQGYFEYGRSIEGKFDRMASPPNNHSAPILGYGWLNDAKYEALPKQGDKGETLVAVYGMSHAKQLGEAIAKIDKKYVIRNITGPGVPPGWSFAAYRRDRNRHEAKAVILGIMTDNVAFLSATSGATSYFDMGHPYTFPRYSLENGSMKEIYPPFYSEEGFRDHLNDPTKWERYREWLSKNDEFYNAYLFRKSITDKFAILRVLRRAYSERFKEERLRHIYTKEGFDPNSKEIVVLKKMLETFADEVQEDGKLPIVYIVNNEGRGDHLYRVLKPILDAKNIPFLSTHVICPPNDPKIFTGTNSHFIPSKDMELAREIINIIERRERGSGRGAAYIERGVPSDFRRNFTTYEQITARTGESS
jgi:hypothetical protein